MLVGLAVICCDYGAVDSLKEFWSLASFLKNAANNFPNNQIIQNLYPEPLDEIVAEIKHLHIRNANVEAAIDDALAAVTQGIDLAEALALPSDLQEYKEFVYLCAVRVAHAAGQGFLGFEERVSAKEESVLSELKSRLELHSVQSLSAYDLNDNASLVHLLKYLFAVDRWAKTLNGVFFAGLFSLAAYEIASIPLLKQLAISPLIVGIVLGAFYANTLGKTLPKEWVPGVNFCTKKILRLAIIFYGVRVSIQDFLQVGISGAISSIFIVITTFALGIFLGQKVFRLDRDVSILTAGGSAICGAAAVLAVEDVLKAKSYKSALAVSTVVLFGTLGMFLAPLAYRFDLLPFDDGGMGIYIGATLHEVAHVAAAGQAVSEAVAKNAVIVKMIRVIMLVPALLCIGAIAKPQIVETSGESETTATTSKKSKILIPWFAILFLVVIVLNSLLKPSESIVNFINTLDTFGLTMAMTALGMETNASKFEGVGMKPIYLGIVLWAWLIFGGIWIVNLIG